MNLIVTHPDSRLEQPGKTVVDFGESLQELIELLHEQMRIANALGLAAHQLGVPLRVFVLKGWPGAFVNSGIEPRGEETAIEEEGCLSLPGLRMPVRRAKQVKVLYQDEHGNRRVRKMRGIDARAAQHEHDHTCGVLITARAELG